MSPSNLTLTSCSYFVRRDHDLLPACSIAAVEAAEAAAAAAAQQQSALLGQVSRLTAVAERLEADKAAMADALAEANKCAAVHHVLGLCCCRSRSGFLRRCALHACSVLVVACWVH